MSFTNDDDMFGYWDDHVDKDEEPRHDMPTVVQLGVAVLLGAMILLWPFLQKRKEQNG